MMLVSKSMSPQASPSEESGQASDGKPRKKVRSEDEPAKRCREHVGSTQRARDVDRARACPVTLVVDTEEWTFAKTMPEWPHEYIVRDRVDAQLFEDLGHDLRRHGRSSASITGSSSTSKKMGCSTRIA